MASDRRFVRIVKNHWGWSLRGLWTWVRYGWGLPVARWGVEGRGRFVKVGPVSFGPFPSTENS